MLLRQMLYRTEIRFLPIIASHWLRLQSAPNYEELIRMLCERMLDEKMLQRFVGNENNSDLVKGIRLLISLDGQAEVERFQDSMGPFRIAGLEKILREKMWKSPISITEKLWYSGIIYREDRMIDGDVKECYIVPEDLLQRFSLVIPSENETEFKYKQPDVTVRPAIPSETKHVPPEENKLIDVFCLAAALKRDEKPLIIPGLEISDNYRRFLEMLLNDGNFFTGSMDVDTEAIRSFLIQNRTAAQIQLASVWRKASDYCELAETDELTVLQLPKFNYQEPRERVIQIISSLEGDIWWSLNGLINAVKSSFPLFLRNSFSDEQWRITDRDGNDLNGMGAWYQLEGAYLRFLLLGPLQWLGVVRIAYADADGKEAAAFRISKNGLFFLTESENEKVSEYILAKPNLEQDLPGISSDGAISCSSSVPRYFRYMCTRYCEIESFNKHNTTVFQITPSSLGNASAKGLKRTAFLQLLRRFSRNKLPPALENMLSVSNKPELPAVIYNATILSVPDENIFRDLLEASRLGKWILQQINPTSVLIDPKGIKDIRRFLMEKEIFVDIQI